LMKGLAFLSAGALVYCIKVSKGNHEPLLLDDLNGVSAKYPLYSLAFTISMLALGGLPLFAGFISKWQILASGIAAQKSWVAFLIALAGINSVLSLGHYAPPINRIYRHVSNNNEVAISPKFQQAMIIPIIILTAAVILLGFFPGITAGITKVASETLYTMFY
ncbi:MAG TPA: proton-conducting transporter membrane subunit, partial [Flexilinea sp.]|nr:proton-conducting transporter membrane subunit [Flexilinea sp.]